jgi:hypothetical protein
MNANSLTAKITKSSFLSDVSAGSGIEFFDGNWYIAGDDVNVLYVLDDQFDLKANVPLFENANSERISKRNKSDIEMLSTFNYRSKQYMLAAGSGSIPKIRENGFLFTQGQQNPIQIDLTDLYSHFRLKLNLSKNTDLNLEGLAADDSLFYFLQRGHGEIKNAIITMKIHDFITFINNKRIPEIEICYFNLLSINGIKSGFSGATFIPEYEVLLFSASAEDTANTYDDGAVLGSFLGLVLKEELVFGQYIHIPIELNDHSFKQKLESIALVKSSKNSIKLVGVCDNDDGATGLVEIEVMI